MSVTWIVSVQFLVSCFDSAVCSLDAHCTAQVRVTISAQFCGNYQNNISNKASSGRSQCFWQKHIWSRSVSIKCKGENSAFSGLGDLSQLYLSNSPNLPAKQFLWNTHASVRALIPLHRLLLRKRESNWAVMVLDLWYSNLQHRHSPLFLLIGQYFVLLLLTNIFDFLLWLLTGLFHCSQTMLVWKKTYSDFYLWCTSASQSGEKKLVSLEKYLEV